jgi:hypothetical protein
MGKTSSGEGGENMGEKREITGNEYLLEIAVFLAASARGCVDEPSSYGSFRLIDALSRLIDLPRYAPCLNDDPFLRGIKAEIDEKKFLVMSDPEGFRNFLDELVRRFAMELKNRAGAQAGK